MGYAELPEIKLYKQYSQSQPVCDFFMKLKEYIDTAYYQGLISESHAAGTGWSPAMAIELEIYDAIVDGWIEYLAANKYGISVENIKTALIGISFDNGNWDIGYTWDEGSEAQIETFTPEITRRVALELIRQNESARRWTIVTLVEFIARVAGIDEKEITITSAERGFTVNVGVATDFPIDGLFKYYSELLGIPQGVDINVIIQEGTEKYQLIIQSANRLKALISIDEALGIWDYNPIDGIVIEDNIDGGWYYVETDNKITLSPESGNKYYSFFHTAAGRKVIIIDSTQTYNGGQNDSLFYNSGTIDGFSFRILVHMEYTDGGTLIFTPNNFFNFDRVTFKNCDFTFICCPRPGFSNPMQIPPDMCRSIFRTGRMNSVITFQNCTFHGGFAAPLSADKWTDIDLFNVFTFMFNGTCFFDSYSHICLAGIKHKGSEVSPTPYPITNEAEEASFILTSVKQLTDTFYAIDETDPRFFKTYLISYLEDKLPNEFSMHHQITCNAVWGVNSPCGYIGDSMNIPTLTFNMSSTATWNYSRGVCCGSVLKNLQIYINVPYARADSGVITFPLFFGLITGMGFTGNDWTIENCKIYISGFLADSVTNSGTQTTRNFIFAPYADSGGRWKGTEYTTILKNCTIDIDLPESDAGQNIKFKLFNTGTKNVIVENCRFIRLNGVTNNGNHFGLNIEPEY